MRAPSKAQLRRMRWARKAVRLDGTTRGGFRWPVGTGGWVTEDVPDTARDGKARGVGLHLGLSWAGLSSAHCLTESLLLCVGYLPDDVVGEDAAKVRVSRCWVLPGWHTSAAVLLRDGWGRDADLARANLADANLPGANLARAYLPGANLARANLARANLPGANLPGANLARANLPGANLARANLAGANLARANLTGAYLPGANLARANLAGANLPGANLPGANLADANLPGANLARANLAGANLAGALADRWTLWPAGFDLVARGVIVR